MSFDINSSSLMKVIFSCKFSNNLEDARQILSLISKNATDILTLDEVGYLQNEVKDYVGSIESLKKCLKCAYDPQQQYAIRANLAKMYNHLNEPLLSIENSQKNLEISQGKDYDTLLELAFSYYLYGNYEKSESMMRELNSIENLPDQVRGRVLYNLGSYDIEKGDFKKGLKGFIDIGHKINIWTHQQIDNVPFWNGEIVKDKTVIIHSEGGIGDEIICVRFLKNLQDLGMNPVWVTHNKSLYEVFNRNGFKTVMNISEIDKSNAVQCMAMYLPILLDLDKDQLWSGSYLTPSEEYIDKWKKLLPEGKKLICKWAGNPYYDQDLHRSLPLELIKELPYEGTKINLQMEPEYEQDDMFNAYKYINSIEDTLAIIALCDDMVTSCTSLAHMAGAMGKNGIVCPPIASYYVWLDMQNNKSNWYGDNLKVFRQTKHKDWSSVFEEVRKTLRETNAR